MGIFSLQEYDYEKVILKVNAEDPLTIAQNPYVSGDWAYITITRGQKHILTVIKKDGTTFNFYWGSGGHTCIGESLELLKSKVLTFIKDQGIILEWNIKGLPDEIHLGYNSSYDQWQITLTKGYDNYNLFFGNEDMDKAEAMRFAIDKFELDGEKYSWCPMTAVTGHHYWKLLYDEKAIIIK